MSASEARLTPPPAVPHTLEDLGLPAERAEQLIVKTLFAGELTGLEMAERMKVPYGLFEPLIVRLRAEMIIEVRGASAASSSSYRYALTDLGRTRALQYLEINLYTGAMPVPLPCRARTRATGARESSRRARWEAAVEKCWNHEGVASFAL